MSRMGMLIAVVVMLVGSPMLRAADGAADGAANGAAPGVAKRSVAVFPFATLGEDAKTGRGAALAETLTTDLTASGGVSAFRVDVADVADASRPAADAASAIAQARDKGASHAVFGSVQSFGAEVRVTGQVLDVKSGQPVGVIRVAGPASNFFGVQDEVTRQVAQAFAVDVPPGVEVMPAPGASPAAGNGLTKSGSGSLVLSDAGVNAAATPLNLPPPVRTSYWEEYKDLYEPAPMVPANAASYAAPTPPPPPVTMMGGYGPGYYGGGGYIDYAYPPGTVFTQGRLGTTRVEYLGQIGTSIIPPAKPSYSVPASSFWAKPQGPDRVTNPNPAITKYKNPHMPALIGVPQRATPGQIRPGASGNPTPAPSNGALKAGASRSK